MTDNHNFNTPEEGSSDWGTPINENFRSLDSSVEIRDEEANLSNYTPKSNAKFLATDTENVYVGDGSQWRPLASTGRNPTFDVATMGSFRATEFAQDSSFLVYNRDGETRALDTATQVEAFSGGAGAAIQYALDNTADGVVKLRSGTYVCNEQLTLDTSTWLVGSGDGTKLKFADGLDRTLLTVPSGSHHARISSLTIDGNKAANSSGDCIRVADSWRVLLDRIVVRDGPGIGIHFPDSAGTSYEPVIVDTDVKGCRSDGYRLSSAIDVFGVDVYAESNAGYGIVIDGPGHVYDHAHAYDSGSEAGILVTSAAGDTRLLAPWGETNARHGILVQGDRTTLLNPYVYDNSQEDPGAYDGVVLDANGCVVTAGVFNDFQGTPTQGHHIRERTESYNNIVAHNQLLNCANATVQRYDYSESRIRDNKGYRTESGGETTIDDGDSITHQLDETPVAYGATAVESGVVASVVDVDSSSLTVEARRIQDGSSAGSNVTVSWFAKGPSAT